MTGHKHRSRPFNRAIALVLGLLMPALMGGCPELRNASVAAIDGGTRSVLFSDIEPREVVDTTTESIVNAVLDLFFEQFQAEETR